MTDLNDVWAAGIDILRLFELEATGYFHPEEEFLSADFNEEFNQKISWESSRFSTDLSLKLEQINKEIYPISVGKKAPRLQQEAMNLYEEVNHFYNVLTNVNSLKLLHYEEGDRKYFTSPLARYILNLQSNLQTPVKEIQPPSTKAALDRFLIKKEVVCGSVDQQVQRIEFLIEEIKQLTDIGKKDYEEINRLQNELLEESRKNEILKGNNQSHLDELLAYRNIGTVDEFIDAMEAGEAEYQLEEETNVKIIHADNEPNYTDVVRDYRKFVEVAKLLDSSRRTQFSISKEDLDILCLKLEELKVLLGIKVK